MFFQIRLGKGQKVYYPIEQDTVVLKPPQGPEMIYLSKLKTKRENRQTDSAYSFHDKQTNRLDSCRVATLQKQLMSSFSACSYASYEIRYTMFLHTNIYTYTHTYRPIITHSHTYIQAHTHTHIHAHTHTHTHAQT